MAYSFGDSLFSGDRLGPGGASPPQISKVTIHKSIL